MLQGTSSLRVTRGDLHSACGPAGVCARLRNHTRSAGAFTRVRAQPAGSVATAPAGEGPAPTTSGGGGDREADVVVIGSGIGGLCCGALAAKYGMQVTQARLLLWGWLWGLPSTAGPQLYHSRRSAWCAMHGPPSDGWASPAAAPPIVQVTVCESHSIPGGAAHAWVQDGYHFEAGPSLYSGMAGGQQSSQAGNHTAPRPPPHPAASAACTPHRRGQVRQPAGPRAASHRRAPGPDQV